MFQKKKNRVKDIVCMAEKGMSLDLKKNKYIFF